jgi:hypothetical protein
MACCELHRIALPVVSEWYQQRHSSFTTLLTRASILSTSSTSQGRQYPPYPGSLLALDRLGGHHTADSMDEVLSQQHCVPVSAKTYAGNVPGPLPVYPVAVEHSRSRISIQHHNIWEAVTGCGFAKERAPCGFEAVSYARCCMQTSENFPSTHSGE